MLWSWLLFFFVAFGAKLLLALVTIYLIFPADRTCDHCDAETVAVRMGPAGRLGSKLLLGALQRRWCPRCGWEGLTRTGLRGAAPGVPSGSGAVRRVRRGA